MAKYSVTTTLAAVPTGNVLLANGARTLNVQVDALAYAALQQSLAGKYVPVPVTPATGTVPTVQADGTIAYVTPSGGSGGTSTYDADVWS